MKAGDYVRTKDGALGKIIDRYKVNDYYKIKVDIRNGWIEKHKEDLFKKHIIKSSPNIIDLIEVGDIITFKDDNDVYRVCGVPDKEYALEVFYLEKKYDGETEDIMVEVEEMKEYIKSIVTKEQFESMEYNLESEVN